MELNLKYIAGIAISFILLIALNVYQFQNPRTIEIPTGTEQIDTTSWVQRSALADAETINDSLRQVNKAMAERIKTQGDQIASYTSITGRLKTQVDSLQEEVAWNSIPLVDRLVARDSTAIVDTTFQRSKTFGDGLFRVDGIVEVKVNPETGFRVRQDFQLEQLRDIRLDVVSTINDDYSRALVYVTSPDFEDLKYQSFTELKPQTKLPKFWIGAGTATVVILGVLIILN